MQNEIDRKSANRILILSVILAILLTSFIWWILSKPTKPIPTKGEFHAVKVSKSETKTLPGVVYVHDGKTIVIDSSKAVTIRNEYLLSKMQYDSLLIINAILDSIAQASNDTRYQKIYNDCKFLEFSHKFEKDTMGGNLSTTVSGISRGAPERLKMTWDIKMPKPKETVFSLWGGLEAGITNRFDNFNAKANLNFQIGENTMINTSFDTDKRIYLGLGKAIFRIKR